MFQLQLVAQLFSGFGVVKTYYLLTPLCAVVVDGVQIVSHNNKSNFSLPSLRMLYLPGAASSEGADWMGVGGGVSSAGLG